MKYFQHCLDEKQTGVTHARWTRIGSDEEALQPVIEQIVLSETVSEHVDSDLKGMDGHTDNTESKR